MRVERVKQSNPWRLPYRCCCGWGPGGTYSHHCGYHSYKEAAAAGVSLYIMYSFSLPPIPSDTLVTGLKGRPPEKLDWALQIYTGTL